MNFKSNLNTDFGPSFSRSSSSGPKPVFCEINNREYIRDEEEIINKKISDWSKDISLLSTISHKLMKEYLIEGTIDIDNCFRGQINIRFWVINYSKKNFMVNVVVKLVLVAEITHVSHMCDFITH